MTRQEFQSSDNLTTALREVFRNPAFQEALAIVKAEGIPSAPIPTHGDLIQQAAIAGAKAHGWHKALEYLELLCNRVVKSEEGQFVEHEDSAAEQLRKLGHYTEDEIQTIVKQARNQA